MGGWIACNNCRGGLGGLGVATAISLVGHRVTVLEAPSGTGEVILFPFPVVSLSFEY